MSISPTYPGVYVTETPTARAALGAVPTSLTVFIGRAPMGPVAAPTPCNSLADAHRQFGPDWTGLPMGQSLSDFFVNGGGAALVVRLAAKGAVAAGLQLDGLPLVAADPGAWGKSLTATVTAVAADGTFSLEAVLVLGGQTRTESWTGLSVDAAAGARRIDRVLETTSQYLRVAPDSHGQPVLPPTPPSLGATATGAGGKDSPALSPQDLIDGLSALDQVPIFNLVVIPPDQLGQDIPAAVWQSAAACCQARLAFLLVDPPSAWTSARIAADQQTATPLMSPGLGRNAAVYFPSLVHGTPFPPSGAVAGVYAATDMARGVWKAPAGTEASLNGIDGLSLPLTDDDSGLINPVGINSLRTFPVYGPVIWGARTLAGAAALEDDYKYVPVRRLALYIEQSIQVGCQWTVFEPNDEVLWSALRLQIGAFLQSLMQQGAVYSYTVACDATTTTPADMAAGIVNVLVSIAPTKPAEFLVIQIQLTTAASA
ncbi:MAG: phage tail sheath protein [Caulobacter sp.]|nr:phage tail sheath protein [Caulobacter sp.]